MMVSQQSDVRQYDCGWNIVQSLAANGAAAPSGVYWRHQGSDNVHWKRETQWHNN